MSSINNAQENQPASAVSQLACKCGYYMSWFEVVTGGHGCIWDTNNPESMQEKTKQRNSNSLILHSAEHSDESEEEFMESERPSDTEYIDDRPVSQLTVYEDDKEEKVEEELLTPTKRKNPRRITSDDEGDAGPAVKCLKIVIKKLDDTPSPLKESMNIKNDDRQSPSSKFLYPNTIESYIERSMEGVRKLRLQIDSLKQEIVGKDNIIAAQREIIQNLTSPAE